MAGDDDDVSDSLRDGADDGSSVINGGDDAVGGSMLDVLQKRI